VTLAGYALDHLTVVDADPLALAGIARDAGYRAICLFMEPMDVLPRMPRFDLYGDRVARRALKARLEALGLGLDLVYPFTLAARTEVEGFRPALECAAVLGAGAINVLVYDRDPARRADRFAAVCDLAREHGLKVALEFYPLSQVGSLAEAVALVEPIGRAGEVGVNVDLLHLMRSGGSIADLAAVPPGLIVYAQQCDGPAVRDRAAWDFEASSQRLPAGQGDFDLRGFATALPPGCPVSIELPREEALAAGVPPLERARQAIDGVRAAVA